MSKDVCGTILSGGFNAIRNRGERSGCREVYVEAALIMHLLFCIPKRRDGVLNPLSWVGDKLKKLKGRLNRWDSKENVNYDSCIKELERKINNLEEEGNDGVIDFDKLEELKEYKLELWELLKLQEDLLRQQARAKWLSKGDTISAYFHRVVKVRAKRGLITKLMFGERWLEDPKILKKMGKPVWVVRTKNWKLRGVENRLSGLLEGVSIVSSGRQGSKGDRVKPLFKYGFCEYGSVNKQWGGYALFEERVRLL
ncbi:hypothetical protein GQ457_12G031300 [Hibiscus cannabinus]